MNLLDEWKKEFNWISSNLNPNKKCDRNDIERLVNIFLQYFGKEYFEISLEQNRTLEKTNWIFELLQQKDLSSLIALHEIGNLVKYLETLDEAIQKKLFSSVKSYKEFQNLLFEIYTYRLLDYNRITNEKKVWRGNQELEGTCKIGEKEFIFECRKSYSYDFGKLDALRSILKQIPVEINKKGVSMVGYIVIKRNYKGAKQKIFDALKKYSDQINSPVFNVPFCYSDGDCEFKTMPYSESLYMEWRSLQEQGKLDIIIKVSPPFMKCPDNLNYYPVEIIKRFFVTQEMVTKKLLETINKKRKQHKASKDKNRLIFIDNEMGRNFRLPLIWNESSIDEKAIQRELNKKDTKDVVCIIIRNYLVTPPKVSIKVFCKEEFNETKRILEGMETKFDYHLN